MGAGVAGWFALPGQGRWNGLYCVAGALPLTGLTLPDLRARRTVLWGGIGLALGCRLVWARSASVAAPRLERTTITELSGRVLAVEALAGKGELRLKVEPDGNALPPEIRLSLDEEKAPECLVARTSYRRLREELTAACAKVDIVVSDRWLPRGCAPRWLKLDRKALEATVGVALHLGIQPYIDSVAG